MLDIHTHILPKMDDGSKDAAESIGMLRLEVEHGISRVALTPHFYPDQESVDAFLARRTAAAETLYAAMDGRGKMPQLLLGAEVAYFRGISRVPDMRRLCIGNSNALLVEMPFSAWTSRMIDELYRLLDSGVQPVIAHMDRYIRQQPNGTLDELCRSGVLLQANASFFLDFSTAWMAMRLLKKQRIHLLGSDCHNMHSRKPRLGEALDKIQQKLGDDAFDYLQYMQSIVLEEQ